MTGQDASRQATAELYRSDDLSGLRKMVEGLSRVPVEFRQLIDLPPRIPIVIDANQAYADILTKLRARAPGYRTDLEELADSGCIAIHAPRLILDEVAEHIDEVSAKYGFRTEDALRAWADLQSRISFHETVSDLSIEITDPDDAPYVALSNELGGALIITRDKAIRRACANATEPVALGPLKQAVRLSVPVAKAQTAWLLFGLVFASAGAEAFNGARRLLSDRRVQVFLLVLLTVAGAGAAIYLSKEENRRKARNQLDKLVEGMEPFIDILAAVQKEVYALRARSQGAWTEAAPFSTWTPALAHHPSDRAKPQRKRTRRVPSTGPSLSTGE